METHDVARVLRARYGGVEATDLLIQFARMELERPDALVLMQNGKFFEVYGHSARLLGRLLDLRVGEKPLMSGPNRQPINLAMTGVAFGGEREHLVRLLRMGYRVAIGREVEGERDGTIKARQLCEVLTPGSLLDEDLLGDERQLLAAVALGPDAAGLALADVSTGAFWCQEWSGPEALGRLHDELARNGPAELLCSSDLLPAERERLGAASGISGLEGERAQRHRALCAELGLLDGYHVGRLSPLPGWWFGAELCQELLQSHFGSVDLRPFELAERPLAAQAAGVLIRYLRWNRFPALERLRSLRPAGSETLQLDATSRRTLDLVVGPDGTQAGSLLAVLDQTRTPMGARLLRSWLTQGLRDPHALAARHDAVEAALGDTLAREEIRSRLGAVRDLERVANRLLIAPERATPKDMTRLRDGLNAAAQIAPACVRLGGLGIAHFDPIPEAAALLFQALPDAPRASLLPRAEAEPESLLLPGWDAELDGLLAQERALLAEIEALVAELYLVSGLRSLQAKRDARSGQMVLSVSAADSRRIPPGWSRIVKGREQYTTDRLRQLSDELIAAEAARGELEQAAWRRLWGRLAEHGPRLIALARDVAQIDVLTTLAHVAARERWTRPQIVAEPTLRIVGGRHPVVCRGVHGYVPASVTLDEQRRLIVLTGPNMSGKSTLMRMVALCVILAQMGSFVPAEAMALGLCDRIFTRIGAAEDIANGRSTFLVEMSEVATIVHQASEHSLVVLDEVGRGTATYDGMALAEAIVEHLHSVTGCRGVFATHYHQLAAQIGGLPHVACLQMGVRREGERLVFMHTLEPGVAEGSFGIAVARMAGLPAAIVARAEARLAELEAEHTSRLVAGRSEA